MLVFLLMIVVRLAHDPLLLSQTGSSLSLSLLVHVSSYLMSYICANSNYNQERTCRE
eukprot:m.186841 g.186841  ORF g.186841 m.186841 type:complete len:57 (+) comp15414_c7_seq1:78-248(+)